MKLCFKNKKALVTGGTRGIGYQIAHDLAALGASVVITGTQVAPNNLPDSITFKPVDFLNTEQTGQFIDFLKTQTFDICVNNAGINKIAPFCEVGEDDWNSILRVNLTVPFLIQQAVSESMMSRQYGRILNVSSIWGTISIPQRASYSSSKFGLRGMTLAAAAELAKDNVLINTISPGFTLTDLTKSILTADKMAEITNKIPIKRMADPREISNVAVFLVSDLNSYMSGQNIVVDGGFVGV